MYVYNIHTHAMYTYRASQHRMLAARRGGPLDEPPMSEIHEMLCYT